MTAPQAMWVVPHTHWDREWYEPHDVFRARLVRMLDHLLGMLEAEPAYKFTLDGQSAAIADYLEIRPEATERVRAAVERGQLALGPFQILLDEFCCDGETIIRNLEHGIRSARTLGREMRVGYLPDMFGHAAQMPQILRGFGIADASLWRGVPGSVRQHGFVWEALDGSAVRVEYLWDGYGSALKLFEPLDKLPDLIDAYLTENADWFGGEPVAGWYGTDHMAPRADLVQILEGYSGGIDLTIGTVEEVITSRDHSPSALGRLPVVRGELRSHARGNLLPGVFSIRTNIKAAMAAAERALTTAERLDAWLGGPSRTGFFDRGWGLVIESTAHDSVTGCGADATADEVESRLKVAAQTAEGAIDISLAGLATIAPVGTVAVFNQSAFARPVQAELIIEAPAAEAPSDVQVLAAMPSVIGDEWLAAEDLPRIIRRIHGQELFGKHIRSWTWEGDELIFTVADHTDDDFDLAAFAEVLTSRMEQAGTSFHVVTRVPESCRVLAAGTAQGLSAVALGPGCASAPRNPVQSHGNALDNGLVRVSVGDDGGVAVTDLRSGIGIEGALRIVDDGDRGDSYNYGPVDGSVGEPESIEIRVQETGFLRGRILVRRTYRLPVGIDPEDRSRRSAGTIAQVVDTVVELRADEPFVRVEVSSTNRVEDHRMRVLVPTLAEGITESASVGQYGRTLRGREAEGGWGEFPLPTYPGTRAISAGGVGVLLDKLVEFEVVDGTDGLPDQIALTALRAVGLMSVNVHPLRDEPAGSQVPVPGAQYLGTTTRLSFAIDLDGSSLVEHADIFRFTPVATAGTGGEPVAPECTLQAHGQVALESLRRVEGGFEARFVNYSDGPLPLRASADGQWVPTDLTGSVVGGPVDLSTHEVPAGGILTLRGGRP